MSADRPESQRQNRQENDKKKLWYSKLTINGHYYSLVHWSDWQLAIESTTPMNASL